MDERYLREMDALALAANIPKEEVRMANLFPELFHCSGFAMYGDATVGGRMYHGRILDYMKGVGLEQNAVVMIYQPDVGNAWVNCGYAGFIGSVTAMTKGGIIPIGLFIVVAGLVVSLGIVTSTFPLLRRVTGPETARND